MAEAPPQQPSDLFPGSVVAGKYRIEHKLGAGGMGAVYAAVHVALGVRVALKVVLPEIAKNQSIVARFLQEARAAARIEGEHIARVTDVGTLESGAPYMVMELLEGEDLGEMIARHGVLETRLAVAYVLQALSGLSEAHTLGVVHRDLKPSNLFVVRRTGKADRVKLLDFGISKSNFGPDGKEITATGSLLGSPAYMSPEQLRSSKNVDIRADIWSVGVILYVLLTGALPFDGETVGAVFAAVLETEPRSPRDSNPTLPEGLSQTILRCLRRDPAERFQTTDELAKALAPFASVSPRAVSVASETFSLAPTALAPSPAGVLQTQGTWSGGASADSPRRRLLWPRVAAGSVAVLACAALITKLLWPTAPAISTFPPSTSTPSSSPSASIAPTIPSADESSATLAEASSTPPAPSPATSSAASPAPATPHPGKVARPKPRASAQSDEALFLRH